MLGNKIFINSVSNIGVVVISNLLALVTLPFYLNLYGAELWGIYIWAASLSGALTRLDFGLRAGIKRFIAKFSVDRNIKTISSGLSVSVSIIGLICLCNFIILIISAFWIDSFLQLDSDKVIIAKKIVFAASVYVITFWGRKISEAVLEGFELFYIKNLSLYFSSFLQLLIFLYAHLFKLDFVLLIQLILCSRAIPFLVNLLTIWRKGLLSGVDLRLKIKKEDLQTDFFKYSTDVFILALLQLLIFKSDVFIIGAISGSASIAIYVVLTKPMFIVSTIDSYLFSALAPIIARKEGKANSQFLSKIIKQGSQINFLIVVPICFIISVPLEDFIHLWIGSAEYDQYIIWGQLATMLYVLRPFYSAITKVLLNSGETKIMKPIKIIFAFTTFISSIVLTVFFGFYGVILGSMLGLFVNIPLYMKIAKRMYGVKYRDIISNQVIKLFIYLTLASVLIFYIKNNYISPLENWLHFFYYLVSISILYFSFSFFVLYKHKDEVLNFIRAKK